MKLYFLILEIAQIVISKYKLKSHFFVTKILKRFYFLLKKSI